ncbi:hypothetical protein M0805_004452 [Coniferiporia weirii]|nr:hypothetical protein M0805_004452 [Coniferiporia weirii]
MHAAAALLVLLAVFTQAVYCGFSTVSFSTIEQCGSFQVNFTGTQAPGSPLSLTIIPFSSYPIIIPLSSSNWDNTSASGTVKVTFLPFSAGTQFVASLDDGDGGDSSLVSDVIAVQNSNNTSCLPDKQNSKVVQFYDIHGLLNQCSHFNVSFNASEITRAPTIRAFLPRYFSTIVNASDSPLIASVKGGSGSGKNGGGNDNNGSSNNGNNGGNNTNNNSDNNNNNNGHNNNSDNNNSNNNNDGNNDGNNSNNSSNNDGGNNDHGHHGRVNISTKEYVLDIVHGFQAVLLLDDGAGHQQTSNLFTTGGNTGSSSGCFKENFNFGLPSQPSKNGTSHSSGGLRAIPLTAEIIIGVLSGCVVTISAVVVLVVFRRKLVCARKVRDATSPKSFVFTEDVDMGSSFVSRIRGRFSQLWASSASIMTGEKRSYRSYRDEAKSERPYEDATSYVVPTSTRGSLALSGLRPASALRSDTEKTLSWVAFEDEINNLNRGMVFDTAVQNPKTLNQIARANPSFSYFTPVAPPPATVRIRTSNPDAPVPAVSQSPSSSRFLFGSGYLSSRSSRTTGTPESQPGVRNYFLQPPSKFFSTRRRPAGLEGESVSISNDTSSGYLTSRSSSALTASQMGKNLGPLPGNTSTLLQSGALSPADSSAPVPITGTPGTPAGTLRREGSRRDAGRMAPFPIVLRGSMRASQ